MIFSLFDFNEKEVKKLAKIVGQINSLEENVVKLSEEEIKAKTKNWQDRFAELSKDKKFHNLNEILPEAYALVREASKRTIGKRHYDVQLMGGIVLHQGKISEQKTGEGKTLTATAPLYLNALTGDGVHLVTANDYLAKHGAGWMAPVYEFLGLKVGVIASDGAFIYDKNFNNEGEADEYIKYLKPCSKKEAYQCDITYGTNHEFGFDYLRDNMASHLPEKSQTNPLADMGVHNFAIVDEVDFVLIDVARTPLIISAPASKPTERYYDAARIVKTLIKETDFEVEEKFKNTSLTDHGIRKVEKMLGIVNLYEQDFEMVHLIEQALSARALFEKDKDYIVKDGKVIIVDQFTGRLLPTNRFSNGLHQAIEAKENCPILEESKTLVVTTSVEKSELLHDLLKRRGVKHEILNAKNHEREASIIAQAGRKGAVTVSTNMAGRGVDILLGGDPATEEERAEIKNLGGLFVIGTERHESRRIDNQLRGRSGRQGDVGESRFYISLQDDLMRIFGGAQIESLMNSLGLDDTTPIESAMVSKSIERAQKKVEGFNFDRRKQVVEMDDVMNVHRTVIYKLRDKILHLGYYGINEDWLIEKLQQYGGLEVESDWSRFKTKMDEKDFLLFISQVMLPIIDGNWMNHLVDMDQVRDGIGLKGYAQRDPMVEYKREGHERFEILIRKIYTETVERLRNIKEVEKVRSSGAVSVEKAVYNQDDYSAFKDEAEEIKESKPKTIVKSEESKIGRNDPCWCGSGKKYKNCHGK